MNEASKEIRPIHGSIKTPVTFKDLAGKVIERWTVLKRVDDAISSSGRKERQWLCICECGNTAIVRGANLKSGNSKSCGCLCRERLGDSKRKHGAANTPEHTAWKMLKQRCLNPRCNQYKNYGARGIKVCDRWMNSFENFIKDMGKRPAGMSIERKDNSKGYEPDNCVWATDKAQCRNKRNNTMITAFGKTLCIAEWSEETGINQNIISDRIVRRKWSAEIALTKKPKQKA